MENPKRSMTRLELYQLVWSTPIQKLAATYGISDRGLAKTCERHLIPVPPRGYWAKIEAGHAVKKTPLRKVENKALHEVHIGTGQTLNARSPYVTEVLARAREEIEQENARLTVALETDLPTAELPEEDEVIAEPKDAGTSINAQPERLRSSVKSFISELRQCKEDRDGFVASRWVKLPPKDISRLGNFLNSLAVELEKFGFSFFVGERRVGFIKGETIVDMRVEAPRKRETENTRYGWKTFTYVHAGRFRVKIDGHAAGIKSEWNDTEARSIEDCVDKIAECVRLNHIANKEWEINARKAERRRAHLAMRRKLAEQRRERENARLEFLREIAEARREADELRATIGLASPRGEVSDDYRKMMEWAQLRLADLERRTTADAIQTGLTERQLFAVPDPLADPEGDPPEKKNFWDD